MRDSTKYDDRVMAILADALARPEAEREAYLDFACPGDAQLLREVSEALEWEQRMGGFLRTPPVALQQPNGDIDPGEPPPAEADATGTEIGPYKLIRQLGEGGMGIVYHARQMQPIRRDVALKIVKPGMDSRQVIARFESERQALAMMDHPNIARVIEAGTTSAGLPYFVMGLVAGLPITGYCDANRLSVRDRLKLFVPVCQAIQHAHQKGIIHRDIKPSNILVELQDGTPVPRVIDFGIARATGPRLTSATVYTRADMVIGTLEYMSPEQAGMNSHDIDTRSDIYSLGVVLYELLTGVTPLDSTTGGVTSLEHMLRVIREEDPPVPSERLRRAKQTPGTVAADRRVASHQLTRLARGELDWIVMKALEKDRARRYDSSNALARDIERYLTGEPVEAGPASTGYRMRKFARRHRTIFAFAAALALLMLVSSVVTAWQAVRARTAEIAAQAQRDRAITAEIKARNGEERARQDRDRAVAAEKVAQIEREAALVEKRRAATAAATSKAVASFLQDDLLSQADANDQVGPAGMTRGPDLTVRTALDRAAQKIGGKFSSQPEVEGAIRKTLGDTYNNLGLFGEAQVQLERAIALQSGALGENHPETLYSMDRLATVFQNEGKLAQAEATMKRELAGRRKALGADHFQTFQTINNLGVLYMDQGRYAEAEPYVVQSLAFKLRRFGRDDDSTFSAWNNLGLLYVNQKKYEQAAKVLTEAVDGRTRILGPEHPRTLISMSNLALAYKGLGKLADSIALNRQILEARRRVLGPEHPSTLRTLLNLSGALVQDSQYAEAEPLLASVWDAATGQQALDPRLAQQAAQKMIDLYGQWGKADKVREWRQKLESRKP